MTDRYFEQDTKFWSIRVEGTSTVVEYGAKGTKPRDTTKDHGTEAAAQAFVAKMIKEKTGKGYVEVSRQGIAAAPSQIKGAAAKDDELEEDEAQKKAPAKRKLPPTITQAAGPAKKREATKKPAKEAEDEEDEEEEIEEPQKRSKGAPAAPKKTAKAASKKGKDEDDDEGPVAAPVEDEEADEPTAPIVLPTPKALPNPGDTMSFNSVSSDAVYTLKHNVEGGFSCSCPAWRNQRGAPDARTCKHLRMALGDEFEDARMKSMGATTVYARANNKGTTESKGKGKSGASATKKMSLLLANPYEESIDPTGWWLSEKLDGVRAYWDPTQNLVLSRLGNAFPVPAWFIEALPKDVSLDGELFLERGEFSKTISIVKSGVERKEWTKIEYRVFDVPSHADEPFEKRMDLLRKIIGKLDTSKAKIVFVEQTVCKSRDHLNSELARVLGLGGEGMMLRKAGSKYVGVRSSTLLKMKIFYDAEAIVTGYEDGKGRLKGLTGSLIVKMASGKTFKIGSGMSDQERAKPPKVGTIVSYAFQELTKDGVPRFPTYRGVAIDKTKPKDAVIRVVVAEEDDDEEEASEE